MNSWWEKIQPIFFAQKKKLPYFFFYKLLIPKRCKSGPAAGLAVVLTSQCPLLDKGEAQRLGVVAKVDPCKQYGFHKVRHVQREAERWFTFLTYSNAPQYVPLSSTATRIKPSMPCPGTIQHTSCPTTMCK